MSSFPATVVPGNQSHSRIGYVLAAMIVLHVMLIRYLPWPENEDMPSRAEFLVQLNNAVQETIEEIPEETLNKRVVEAETELPEEREALTEPTSTSINFGELREQMRRSVAGLASKQSAQGLSESAQNVWAGKIGAGPSRREALNQVGMVTARIVDRWGNARCLQQRGDPFDPET